MIKKIYWRMMKQLSFGQQGAAASVMLSGRRFTLEGSFRNHMKLTTAYEEWLDKPLAAALATRSGAIIDVGANLGQTLIKLLSLPLFVSTWASSRRWTARSSSMISSGVTAWREAFLAKLPA